MLMMFAYFIRPKEYVRADTVSALLGCEGDILIIVTNSRYLSSLRYSLLLSTSSFINLTFTLSQQLYPGTSTGRCSISRYFYARW